MKVFFGGGFIQKEDLEAAGIEYPVKLEYYKIINEECLKRQEKPRYGINVVKTEYINNIVKTEDEIIKHLSDNEKRIEEILEIFKEHKVTPITVQDVISDFAKNLISI